MKKLLVYTYIVVLNVFLSALYANDTLKLDVSQMHDDVDYYFNTMQKNHPAMYLGYPELFVDSIKKDVKKQCSVSLPVDEFNYILARTNKYFDGHTGITYLQETNTAFPVVGFDDEGFSIGNSSILDIEGIPAQQIADDLDKIFSWEFGDKGRKKIMNSRLNPLLEGHYKLKPPYACLIRNKHILELKDTIINTVGIEEWWKTYQPLYNSRYHVRPMDFEYHPADSIAILYYNSSKKPDEKNEEIYEKAVASYFDAMKKYNIKYLFIDVSQNGGGSDLTHEYIYKYLKSKSYMGKGIDYGTPSKAVRIYNEWLDALRKEPENKDKTEEEIRSILEAHKKFEALKELFKTGKSHFEFTMEGNDSGFEGKVFVIMGWQTYSAAYDFCQEVKRSQIGTLVGEISMQRYPFAGDIIRDNLPHSKISFYYPTTFSTTEPVVTNSEGFLEPDIPYPMDHPLGLEDYKKIIGIVGQER